MCRGYPALRQHRRRQRSRTHFPRCAECPRQQGRRSHRPGCRPPSSLPRRRAETGTAHDRGTFVGQRLAEGAVGQVGGRHAGAQHRDDDRAGGRADEQIGAASIPAELAFERGEHAGVKGVAHRPAGSEHDGDSGRCHADSLPRSSIRVFESIGVSGVRRPRTGHSDGPKHSDVWENGRTEEAPMPRPTLRIAIVAYQGVLADESWAFRSVLSRIPGARVLTVGDSAGIVAGPGGAQQVVATFDDVTSADVVVIPGGLGSHRHPEISAWLRRLRPRWVLTSSTGSALLAAGGLLARTHRGDTLARRAAARALRCHRFRGAPGRRSSVRHVHWPGQHVRRRVRRRCQHRRGECSRPHPRRTAARPRRRTARAVRRADEVPAAPAPPNRSGRGRRGRRGRARGAPAQTVTPRRLGERRCGAAAASSAGETSSLAASRTPV